MGDGQGVDDKGVLTQDALEKAVAQSLASFGKPNHIWFNPQWVHTFERAPSTRKGRSVFDLIGVLRQLDILDPEIISRNADVIDPFIGRLVAKKLFTRKRSKEYKKLLRK